MLPLLLTHRIGDRRAVSPVIGVILMVAITVILAAVIGTFVLGMGADLRETAPTATVIIQDHPHSFQADDDAEQNLFQINHRGGRELAADELALTIRNASTGERITEWRGGGWADQSVSWSDSGFETNDSLNGGDPLEPAGFLSTGDRLVITVSNNADESNPVYHSNTRYEITIIHVPSNQPIVSKTVRLR